MLECGACLGIHQSERIVGHACLAARTLQSFEFPANAGALGTFIATASEYRTTWQKSLIQSVESTVS